MSDPLARWLSDGGPALERLVRALRGLIETAVTSVAPPAFVDDATARVEAVTALLRPHVPDPLPPRYLASGEFSGPDALMPFDPVSGRLSPIAPPLALSCDTGVAIATVCFETPYEGPPGCVHGGVIAACFDQVLNAANLAAGVPGLTASLEVRYRRPTPLRAPLRFEAGPPAVDGKQVRTTGTLSAGDVVTAEAVGSFVRLPLDRIMTLTNAPR